MLITIYSKNERAINKQHKAILAKLNAHSAGRHRPTIILSIILSISEVI